jgi:hypothetical protein
VTVHVVLSYVPLLRGQAGATMDLERVENIVGPVFETDAGHVEAVVWAQDERGLPWPILVLDRADEVFEQLVEWAESSPASWFTVAWAARADEYALALMPRAERSVERYRLARQLTTGEDVPAGARFEIIFRPILFRGPVSALSRDMLGRLPERVKVGFLRRSALPVDVANIDPSSVLFCGPLEVVHDRNGYLGGLLKRVR